MNTPHSSSAGKQKALPFVLAAAIAGFGALSVASVLMGDASTPAVRPAPPVSATTPPPLSAATPAVLPAPKNIGTAVTHATTAPGVPSVPNSAAPVPRPPPAASTDGTSSTAPATQAAALVKPALSKPTAAVAVVTDPTPTTRPPAAVAPTPEPVVVKEVVQPAPKVAKAAPAAPQAPIVLKRKEPAKAERVRAEPKSAAPKPAPTQPSTKPEPVITRTVVTPPVAVAAKDVNNGYVPLIIKPAEAPSRAEAQRNKRSNLSIVSEAGSRVWLRINDTQTVMIEKGQEAPGLGKFLGMEKGQATFERGVVTDRLDGN